jgi:hypothetical protein
MKKTINDTTNVVNRIAVGTFAKWPTIKNKKIKLSSKNP